MNLVRGVAERVFFVKDKDGVFRRPPEAHGQAFKDRMRKFSEELAVRTVSTTPYTYEQFANTYSGRKRTIYCRAAESLRVRRLVKRDAKVQTFVKWEKTNITLKPNFVPRVIQPRHPRFNVAVGRYLAKVEKTMMKTIDDVFGQPTIMSGLNSEEQAKVFHDAWDGFTRPVAVSIDASRFDQHVGQVALKWEHKQWRRYFTAADKDELKRLLKMQLVNHGQGYAKDGKIEYVVEGCRMSGDMNTSSGNKVLMCGLIYSYMQARKIRKYRLLNNGDDCVIMLEQSQLKQFLNGLVDWFTTMGFTMVAEEPVYRLEEIEFCQTRPIFDGEQWRMVRKYPLALEKDTSCFISAGTGKLIRRWMNGVGAAGLSLSGGIPIAQEFYQAYLRNSAKYNLTKLDEWSGLARLSKGMGKLYQSISPAARASFYSGFGINPDVQVIVEEALHSWTLEGSPKHIIPVGRKLPGNPLLLMLCKCPLLGRNSPVH